MDLCQELARAAQVLSSAPSTDSRALVLSTSLPHAGNWLNRVPSLTLGLHLDDQELCCCLRYWLGIPLHSSPYSCPECRGTADQFGDHQVGCGGDTLEMLYSFLVDRPIRFGYQYRSLKLMNLNSHFSHQQLMLGTLWTLIVLQLTH